MEGALRRLSYVFGWVFRLFFQIFSVALRVFFLGFGCLGVGLVLVWLIEGSSVEKNRCYSESSLIIKNCHV